MKNKFLVGIVLLLFIQSCDKELENPDYPNVPSIKLEKVKFIETADVSDYDTLKFSISYRDGDSDLGLSSTDALPPYHPEYFFLEDGTGDTTQITQSLINNRFLGIIPQPNSGLLVNSKTREKANYTYLPYYNPSSCVNYSFMNEVLVPEAAHAIDESFVIQDTISINGVNFISVQEVLLYKTNENFYNIFVEFYILSNGVFNKFDWLEQYCITYNGRFPLIGDTRDGIFKSGNFKINIKNPQEGEITYNMPNSSFLPIFGDTPIKLAITIKDRMLNTSNTIMTSAFKLRDIK